MPMRPDETFADCFLSSSHMTCKTPISLLSFPLHSPRTSLTSHFSWQHRMGISCCLDGVNPFHWIMHS